MSTGINKVFLLGALGADPELKVVNNSQHLMRLRLATSESYKDNSGTWQERTEWHSISVWGKRADALSKLLTKGTKLFIEGKLRTSSYEKNGEKRYRTEIVATDVFLLGSKPQQEKEEDDWFDQSAPELPAPPAYNNDDIPF